MAAASFRQRRTLPTGTPMRSCAVSLQRSSRTVSTPSFLSSLAGHDRRARSLSRRRGFQRRRAFHDHACRGRSGFLCGIYRFQTVVATKNACEFCSWHRYYLCYSCGSAIYREHICAAYSCIGITKQRGRSLLRCFTCTDICPYILCPYKCTDTVGANHIRESPSNKAIDARAGNML